MKTNKEKYEGKLVAIKHPFLEREFGLLQVTEVMDENVLYGFVPGMDDFWTAYYLSDGIRVTVKEVTKDENE